MMLKTILMKDGRVCSDDERRTVIGWLALALISQRRVITIHITSRRTDELRDLKNLNLKED
jgi:hypothetical protein